MRTRNRGYQSTQTTALASGLFVLLALVNMLMIVAAVVFGPPARIVEFRFGIPPATPEQARARIGEIAELADAEHAMAEVEATRDEETKVIEDATQRSH
jgi:hypothetical protein